MEPVISKISEEKDKLTFTLSGVNVSIANGLRRIASEIPTIVFRTSPHEANKAKFEINTSRMNNELLKQRLSCIPIMAPPDFQPEDYIMVVDKQNKSSTIEYVSTADFEVYNTKTKEKDTQMAAKLFPPNPLTGDYPELVRLLPRVSENIEGERLSLRAEFDVGTAAQDSAFNVVSSFVYGNTLDPIKIKTVWTEKKNELTKAGIPPAEMAFAEKDWYLLEAKRYYLPDSFDFTVETVGQYTNMKVVYQCTQLMMAKLQKLQNDIQSDMATLILPSETTIPNSFDIILKNEDYTLGKVIEYVLYNSHYDKTLNYCGFRKPHPHIAESIIRIGFKNPTEKLTVVTYIVNAANDALRAYEKIATIFKVIE